MTETIDTKTTASHKYGAKYTPAGKYEIVVERVIGAPADQRWSYCVWLDGAHLINGYAKTVAAAWASADDDIASHE